MKTHKNKPSGMVLFYVTVILTLVLGSCDLFEVHKHIYSETGRGTWIEVVPTCSTPGILSLSCQAKDKNGRDCETREKRDIPPDQSKHDWRSRNITIQPTCISYGTGERYCNNPGCEETENSPDNLPLTDHSVSQWEGISSPTCSLPGRQRGNCNHCHEQISSNISALGHDWRRLSGGNNRYQCNRCFVISLIGPY